VGEFACGATVSTGLPSLTPAEAVAKGARGLVIGVANPGGVIPASWRKSLVEALEAGLDIVSGMHVRLADIPELAEAAALLGRRLIDIRVPPLDVPVGNGRKRSGKRLLTVGTDCALGKKYTALALARAFEARGWTPFPRHRPDRDHDRRRRHADGRGGLRFRGRRGRGAQPRRRPDHWDVIEGQGSLVPPGLCRGIARAAPWQPAGRVRGLSRARPHRDARHRGLQGGEHRGDHRSHHRARPADQSGIRCGGVSFNTSALDEAEALEVMRSESARLGLPVADPVRGGPAFDALVDSCLA
jgi:uncharacterized NAD-dependent epimerase/dehydratase family protein